MKYPSPFITIFGVYSRVYDIDVRKIVIISDAPNSPTRITLDNIDKPIETEIPGDKVRKMVNEKLQAIEEYKEANSQATLMKLIDLIKENKSTNPGDLV